ncbi:MULTISPECIES: phosphoribosylglycinamide formyltransferase [unclassified Enterococcus]|uniref:phosphoribosylglycinamide formyltransferase n=1 Tax=unclassified Enterococcus TaxID=2608891 RepID=UPI001557631C|nr:MULTISPECIES: phosphoribosylglycinamide formyltransferase [unclassified Enterococcus]MBS7578178.1 phosphoribosylglycinamide formyltransferase [Enterococcus sp. MMGLQ5-2]MBS7584006.1 phosphoribosylglycinamide formyltransferase [Enterococcus sp. MMGLQ5-1]NPD11867.1 phosphoribosylglycinamide formyltransferase [Enterococcus sp. MMGLQ5-1]NPD38009.1 phosphoribosylglycinamide formyltransferase [Enterococcus sp. MMGLQ5-2]
MTKLAIFASGNGSNFEVLAKAINSADFPAKLEFVFSDKRQAFVLERAEKLSVPSYTFELKEFSSKVDYELAIIELLDKHQVDFILLAGYMKIVGQTLLEKYEGRIINIHPALLPNFKGAHGIEDAFKAGVSETGVTIHYVDSNVDTGEIIVQERVLVDASDTLATLEAKIHQVEHRLYPAVVRQLIEKKGEQTCF